MLSGIFNRGDIKNLFDSLKSSGFFDEFNLTVPVTDSQQAFMKELYHLAVQGNNGSLDIMFHDLYSVDEFKQDIVEVIDKHGLSRKFCESFVSEVVVDKISFVKDGEQYVDLHEFVDFVFDENLGGGIAGVVLSQLKNSGVPVREKLRDFFLEYGNVFTARQYNAVVEKIDLLSKDDDLTEDEWETVGVILDLVGRYVNQFLVHILNYIV